MKGLSRRACHLLGLGLVLVFCHSAGAETLELAFGRRLDTTMIEQAVKLEPAQLIRFIQSQGLKTYRYPSAHKPNPDLATMPLAPKAISGNATIVDFMADSGAGATAADAGIFIPDTDEDLGAHGPFLIISDSSTTHTLIHEFSHYVFDLGESAQARKTKAGLGMRAFRSDRELNLQLKYLDRYAASSNKYQRDHLMGILVGDMVLEGHRARDFVTEEATIEILLSKLMGPGQSPYHHPKRVREGLEYARSNIRSVHVRLEAREYLFLEIRRIFEGVAGNLDSTSNTEREEIIASLQAYRAALDETKLAILQELAKIPPL